MDWVLRNSDRGCRPRVRNDRGGICGRRDSGPLAQNDNESRYEAGARDVRQPLNDRGGICGRRDSGPSVQNDNESRYEAGARDVRQPLKGEICGRRDSGARQAKPALALSDSRMTIDGSKAAGARDVRQPSFVLKSLRLRHSHEGGGTFEIKRKLTRAVRSPMSTPA